jgi:thymidylate kinase
VSLIHAPDIDRPAVAPGAGGETISAPLVARLGAALQASSIKSCQWKGSGKVERWGSGEGDIDLLVERTALAGFTELLAGLGFKPAFAAPERAIPGIISFVGLDEQLGRLIHIHAHFALILGRADTRHYHLAIERAVHKTAFPRLFFKTPAPEYEFILFVLQQTLRHDPLVAPGATTDRIAALQPELTRLERLAEPAAVVRTLAESFPDIGVSFFERCLGTLRPGASRWRGLAAHAELGWRLRAHGHGGTIASWLGRALKKIARAALPNSGFSDSGKRLAGGGAVIALIGADGAGKSTCARALQNWLAAELNTCHAHLGRPPRSPSTLAAGGALKLGVWLDRLRGRKISGLTAHLELLRHLATARDRHRLFSRVQRFATAGGIAICERYPIPAAYGLAGPSRAQGLALDARTRFARGLRRVEAWYYQRITAPDQIFVLRVEPEVAVRRKTDEPEDYVRARARRMWTTDWSNADAIVIDAGRPIEEVLTDLRARIWESL